MARVEQLPFVGRQSLGPLHRRIASLRSRRTARALLIATVAMAVLVALLGRGSGPGAVDGALAAAGKSPPDAVIHFTSVTRNPVGAFSGRTELWAATTPPYARRSIIQGPETAAIEQSAAGNEVMQFDPAGVVYVRTIEGGTAEGTHPADFGASIERLRSYLREGDAEDVGLVTVNGARLHRFALSPPGGGSCLYDVQPDTSFGVSLTCRGVSTGSISERWEYLPRKGSEQLLSVLAAHPTVRVDRDRMQPCSAERHTPGTPPCIVVSAGA